MDRPAVPSWRLGEYLSGRDAFVWLGWLVRWGPVKTHKRRCQRQNGTETMRRCRIKKWHFAERYNLLGLVHTKLGICVTRCCWGLTTERDTTNRHLQKISKNVILTQPTKCCFKWRFCHQKIWGVWYLTRFNQSINAIHCEVTNHWDAKNVGSLGASKVSSKLKWNIWYEIVGKPMVPQMWESANGLIVWFCLPRKNGRWA